MENATKALLIAASVLIAIVIIALGIMLLRGSGDSTKQATEVGEQISDSSNKVIKGLQGYKQVNTENFKTNFGSDVITNEINTHNVRKNIWIKGYMYKKYDVYVNNIGWGIDQNTCLKDIDGETTEQRHKRIIEQVSKSDDFIAVKNVTSKEKMIKEIDSYLKANASVPEGTLKGPFTSVSIYYSYDNERIYR